MLMLAIASWPGCSPPQVPADARELVQLLATATSSRDGALIRLAVEEIEEHRAAGMLDDEAHDALSAVVDAARSGDWERAQRLAYALRDAQRPTAEDVERIRQRTLHDHRTHEDRIPHDHSHDHPHGDRTGH